MLTREEIFKKVADVISQVTLADRAGIKESSHLFDELGVESIDFVDIIYNLETAFDIEISNESLFTDRDFFNPESGYWANDTFTTAGEKAISEFEYLTPDTLSKPNIKHYLYSVEMLVDYVQFRTN